MTQINEVYKCNLCGNIVEVAHAGAGTLVCCGQNMQAMTANTVEAATEKHVPVVEKTDGKILVRVGEVDHPMEASHYIEWIEVIDNESGQLFKQMLNPGDMPWATFDLESDDFIVRTYCNLHGLWQSN